MAYLTAYANGLPGGVSPAGPLLERTRRGTRILPVTVVIPAHNREVMVRRALRSVASQAPSAPAEVIVVDDASADRTADVAEGMGVHVIRHERNQGESVARNSGVVAATQPWIALLDSDDEWCPHHLDALWRIRGEHVLVAASVLIRADDHGHDRFSGPVTSEPVVLTSPAALLHPQNFVPTSATMVRRQALLDVGGYRRDLRRAEDLDLLLRVLERGTGIVMPAIGALYHEHPGQQSRQRREMRVAHQDVAAAYAGRAWSSPSLLARVSGAILWDDLREALAHDRKAEALRRARLLAFHPQRALGVAAMLAWRRLGRRRTSMLSRTADSTEAGGRAMDSPTGGIASCALEALLLRFLDLTPVTSWRTDRQPP